MRREQILATTAHVWGERGVARVRVADIATRLGVSVGLIPYHFGSKEDVIAATFQRIAEEDLIRVTGVDDEEPTARMAHMLERYLTNDPAWGLWLNAYGEALHMPALHQTILASARAWHAVFEREIQRGVDAGAWTCDDPGETAARIIASIDGIGIHVALGMLDVDPARGFDWGRRLVARELGIPPEALAREGVP